MCKFCVTKTRHLECIVGICRLVGQLCWTIAVENVVQYALLSCPAIPVHCWNFEGSRCIVGFSKFLDVETSRSF